MLSLYYHTKRQNTTIKIKEKVEIIKMNNANGTAIHEFLRLQDRNDTMRYFSQFQKKSDPFGINFVGKSVCDSNFYTERRISQIMSFEFIEEGSGTLEINGQVLHPSQNDVFLLTEGSNHRYYTEAKSPWRKYFVSFVGPLANKMKELYLPYNTFLFKNCDLKDNFKKIFDVAFDEALTYEEINSQIAAEILKIMIYLNNKNTDVEGDLAEKIKNKIDYCIEGELSLDTIASSLSYTKNHIINVFKEKYNKTPYQYFMQAKIEIAKRYLTQTNCSISDIAFNLSFSDAQYFSSTFKKVTGVSPREYRKSVITDF